MAIPDFDLEADAENVGTAIRSVLGVSVAAQAESKSEYSALTHWIDAVEAAGALVFQMSRVATDEVRGFSLFEQSLPVVVLNGGESARARTFTLMHEVAHTAFRAAGLCDFEGTPGSAAGRVESAANRVAAAILMPIEDFAEQTRSANLATLAAARTLANRYWVSVEAVLLRFVAARRIDEPRYQQLLAEYRESFQSRRTSGGGDFYRTFVRNNGYRYTGLLVDAFDGDRITPAEFAHYSGGKLNHLSGILRVLQSHEMAQEATA